MRARAAVRSATPEGWGSVGPGARGLPGRSMRAARSAVSRERNGSFSNSQAVLGRVSCALRNLTRGHGLRRTSMPSAGSPAEREVITG